MSVCYLAEDFSSVLQPAISCRLGWTVTDRVREMTLRVERGPPAELERPVVRVHGMLAGQERQVVTTGANEHVTHLMSGYSYRWAALQCSYAVC